MLWMNCYPGKKYRFLKLTPLAAQLNGKDDCWDKSQKTNHKSQINSNKKLSNGLS